MIEHNLNCTQVQVIGP